MQRRLAQCNTPDFPFQMIPDAPHPKPQGLSALPVLSRHVMTLMTHRKTVNTPKNQKTCRMLMMKTQSHPGPRHSD